MAERTGSRALTYSAWHRQESMRRYTSLREAAALGMIDVDAVEYRADDHYEPVALIEIAHDTGKTFKPAHVTARLADMAGIPAYVVFYTPSNHPNPAARFGEPDIEQFRVAKADDQTQWQVLTPSEYVAFLRELREQT